MPRKLSLYCKKCGELKTLQKSGALRCRRCATEWDKQNYHSSSLRREKDRRRHLLLKYNAALEQIEGMFNAQKERCAICLRHWTECPAPRPSRYEDGFLQHLYVDHDHITGTIRGLLCHGCNGAIGLFKDDPNIAEAAATYLEVSHVEAKR